MSKLNFNQYKNNSKVECIKNAQFICTSFLYNKNYKKNGLRVLPNISKLWAKTKEEAIKLAFNQYQLIIQFLSN